MSRTNLLDHRYRIKRRHRELVDPIVFYRRLTCLLLSLVSILCMIGTIVGIVVLYYKNQPSPTGTTALVSAGVYRNGNDTIIKYDAYRSANGVANKLAMMPRNQGALDDMKDRRPPLIQATQKAIVTDGNVPMPVTIVLKNTAAKNRSHVVKSVGNGSPWQPDSKNTAHQYVSRQTSKRNNDNVDANIISIGNNPGNEVQPSPILIESTRLSKEQCPSGMWGSRCQPCKCSSYYQSCDVNTGICTCPDGMSGAFCDIPSDPIEKPSRGDFSLH